MITVEDIRKRREKYRTEEEAFKKHLDDLRRQDLEKKGLKPFNQIPEKGFHGDCDHPNTMENSTATILWIFTMAVGAIFNARLLIWGVATFVWLKFITRHKRKK